MLKISNSISTGANQFLHKEYGYLSVFCLLLAIILYFTVDLPAGLFPYTTLAFLIGAATSMVCGFVGMQTAVMTNVRTTWSCCQSIDDGFRVAYQGGQVLGFTLVGLALFILQLLIIVYRQLIIQPDKIDN